MAHKCSLSGVPDEVGLNESQPRLIDSLLAICSACLPPPFRPFVGRLLFYYIIFGRVRRFRPAAFLLFSAVLAIFGRLHFYYLRPFWPFFA